MENYKQVTTGYYDSNALLYQSLTENYIEKLGYEINLFLENLKGRKILDLGSGSGRDSLFFKNSGFQLLCVDISKEMMHLCKEKGLTSLVMDIEDLGFRQESFDGIWSYTSLLHVPRIKIRNALSSIHACLKKDGVLFVGMKEGDFEGFHKNQLYKCSRFYSLYQDDNFRKILSEHFEILFYSKTITDKNIYLNYLCKPT